MPTCIGYIDQTSEDRGWWAVRFTDDLSNMFKWKTGGKWCLPRSGVHCSFIRGEHEESQINHNILRSMIGCEIEMDYELDLHSNGESFWLNASCDQLDDIREMVGAGKFYRDTYHITLGNFKHKRTGGHQ